MQTPKKYRHLLGKSVKVNDNKEAGFVAAVDRRKGITVEDIDGNQLICLNRADFKRAGSLYYYQQIFDLLIEAIRKGRINTQQIYKESGYIMELNRRPFGRTSQCAFK